MIGWLKSLFGASRTEDRRKYARYPVSAPLEVIVGEATHACRIDNVSAGGVRLKPAFSVDDGTDLVVRDPRSELRLDGTVVGRDEDGIRVRFKSEDAGIIVSAWLRVSNEPPTHSAATSG